MEEGKMPLRITRRQIMKGGAIAGLAGLSRQLLGGTIQPRLAEAAAPAEAAATETKLTACWIGKQGCVLEAKVANGVVSQFGGFAGDPRSLGRPCLKGAANLFSMYDPYRVKTPLIRTNAKGEPGKFKEATWGEALALVGSRIKEVKARDPKKIAYQTGGSKQGMVGRDSLMRSVGGAGRYGSATCYNAMGSGAGYNTGFSHGFNADLRYTNFLLVWGSSMRDGGPSGICWVTWQHPMREARKRGMNAVLIDPRLEAGANQVDEWLPIKPSTDLALLLAMANVLIEQNFLDVPFLLERTNSPFLVKADGHFLRQDDKNVVWDTKSNSARPFDAEGIQPALEGGYTVDGVKVKTAFQLLKEHVAENTPEWAAEITGLPAAQIRKLALRLGTEARIGSTITIDGVKLPYRPVGMMSYHGFAQQEKGYDAARMATTVFMLLGAIHAVGGFRIGFNLYAPSNFDDADNIKIVEKPTDIALTSSKWWPIGGGGGSALAWMATANPEKYGVEDLIPEMLITFYGNPFLSNFQADVKKGLEKIKYVVGIESHLIEELDYYADVVLPSATIEKYDGLVTVRNTYVNGSALRLPPVPPLYQSKADMDVYMDIAEAAGVLTGKGGFLERLNSELGLKDANALDIEKRPELRDVFDRWAKQAGHEDGIKFYEEHGCDYTEIAVRDLYAAAWKKPYGGIRYRIYGEGLLTCQEKMRKMGVEELFWQDYTALPTWRQPTMELSPKEYDLYFIDYKNLPFFHSQATYNPLLHEMAPEQRLLMNSLTAKAKGLKDGDLAEVESHNAITKETRKVTAKVKVTEGMQPDTVGFYHGYGHWVHPVARNSGPAGSELFFLSEGYLANPTATTSHRTKVKVSKA